MAIRYYRWRESIHKMVWALDQHWYAFLCRMTTPRFQLGECVFVPLGALDSDDDRVVVIGYVIRLWEGERVTVDWMNQDGLWDRETFHALELGKVSRV